MTQSYLEIYGDVIQAFRPSHKKDLLYYLAKSSGLKRGMHILDAGCGVGGPAVYFAKEFRVNVDGITISPVQVQEANMRVRAEKVEKSVAISEGDYHHLSDYFKAAAYDAVYFLESLGHSNNPDMAIREAQSVLKKGGYIYIKDFYRKISNDAAQQARIDRVIGNMNKHYSYNTLDLSDVLHSLRIAGFEIIFIKRFDFKDDIGVRFEFERVNQIDIFEGMDEFWPAEWLEIKCIKI
jgi:cyclopropane fatty-acyl-phospholipid synthase-like methyltransferase